MFKCVVINFFYKKINLILCYEVFCVVSILTFVITDVSSITGKIMWPYPALRNSRYTLEAIPTFVLFSRLLLFSFP